MIIKLHFQKHPNAEKEGEKDGAHLDDDVLEVGCGELKVDGTQASRR
jgi:hypothetical protein